MEQQRAQYPEEDQDHRYNHYRQLLSDDSLSVYSSNSQVIKSRKEEQLRQSQVRKNGQQQARDGEPGQYSPPRKSTEVLVKDDRVIMTKAQLLQMLQSQSPKERGSAQRLLLDESTRHRSSNKGAQQVGGQISPYRASTRFMVNDQHFNTSSSQSAQKVRAMDPLSTTSNQKLRQSVQVKDINNFPGYSQYPNTGLVNSDNQSCSQFNETPDLQNNTIHIQQHPQAQKTQYKLLESNRPSTRQRQQDDNLMNVFERKKAGQSPFKGGLKEHHKSYIEGRRPFETTHIRTIPQMNKSEVDQRGKSQTNKLGIRQATDEVQKHFQRQQQHLPQSNSREEDQVRQLSKQIIGGGIKSKSVRQLAQTPRLNSRQKVNDERSRSRSSRAHEEHTEQKFQWPPQYLMNGQVVKSPEDAYNRGYLLSEGLKLVQQETPPSSSHSSISSNAKGPIVQNLRSHIQSQMVLMPSSYPQEQSEQLLQGEMPPSPSELEQFCRQSSIPDYLSLMKENSNPQVVDILDDDMVVRSEDFNNTKHISDEGKPQDEVEILSQQERNGHLRKVVDNLQSERAIPIDKLFDFLIREEDQLSQYLHLLTMAQMVELNDQIKNNNIRQQVKRTAEDAGSSGFAGIIEEYSEVIKAVDSKKERPIFFAKQLQLTLIIANALVRSFTVNSYLNQQLQFHKYGQKLRTIYSNTHASFLLIIDLVLGSPLCSRLSPKENAQYIYLKKVLSKKMKVSGVKTPSLGGSPMKRSQKLTQFRQNNEVSILNIKKIVKTIRSQASLNGSSDPSSYFMGVGDQASSTFLQENALADAILDVLWAQEQISISQVKTRLGFSRVAEIFQQDPPKRPQIQVLQNLGRKQADKKRQSPTSPQRQKGTQSPLFASPRSSQSLSGDPQNKKTKELRNKYSPQRSERSDSLRYGSVNSSRSDSVKQNQQQQQHYSCNSFQSNSTQQNQRLDGARLGSGSTRMKKQIVTYPGGMLPETIAFIVDQCTQNNNGAIQTGAQGAGSAVTNINNTINIYSTSVLQQPPNTVSSKVKPNSIPGKQVEKKKVKNMASPKNGSGKAQGVAVVDVTSKNLRPQSRMRESSALKAVSGSLSKGNSSQIKAQTSSYEQQAVGVKKTKKHNLNVGKQLSQEATSTSSSNFASNQQVQDDDDCVEVYRVSQQFMKQYKPIISGSKGSKFIQQTGAHNSSTHHNSQILLSKKKGTDPRQLQTKAMGSTPSGIKGEPHATATSTGTKKRTKQQDYSNKEVISPYSNSSKASSATSKSNQQKGQQQSSAAALAFKETLAQAITAAAYTGISILSDGTDIALIPPPSTSQPYTHKQLTAKANNPSLRYLEMFKGAQEPILLEPNKDCIESYSDKDYITQDSHSEANYQNAEETPSKILSPNGLVHFGNLIERNFGSFDLKKEMEILKSSPKSQMDGEMVMFDVQQSEISQDNNETESNTEEDKTQHLDERKIVQKTTEQKTTKASSKSSKMEIEFQRLKALVTIPYLPPLVTDMNRMPQYTLVLDLDETLIHLECDEEENENSGDEQNEDGVYYLIRPGAIKFLNELSKYYEIVIFTAAMPDYADWIMDNVDRHGVVKHRLYRQHTTPHEDYAIKDLRNLGRPLERTIIIDNLAENFIHTTPDNGIWVESWYDDMDDTVLEILTPFLKDIVTSGAVPDVRKLLTKEFKEGTLYRCLQEGKQIPRISPQHQYPF